MIICYRYNMIIWSFITVVTEIINIFLIIIIAAISADVIM